MERGENRASGEDIEEVTSAIEENGESVMSWKSSEEMLFKK